LAALAIYPVVESVYWKSMTINRALAAEATAIAEHPRRYDVLVAGGGNAALCAAIAARRAGASVLVLEAADKFYRGGNTRHTRNMRCAHDTATEILTGPYTEDEFWDDLNRVTGGNTDEDLARHMIRESKDMLGWIGEQGVRFQPSIGGTLSLGRTNSFFLGGGRAMLNALYLTAERLGVDIRYEAEVMALDIEDGMFLSAVFRDGPERAFTASDQRRASLTRVRAGTLVAASGGFEANIEWLKEGWGEIAENFLIRGSPHNRGTVLKMLLDNGVQPVGDPTQCHAVAIDARAPKFDGGIITRLDCVVFGIVVNRDAERFYDEGEDIWPKRYAIWGRLVAAQPGQIAYIVFDAPSLTLFMPSLYPPISAGSIGELAGKLELDPAALEKTVSDFNAAVRPGTFDPTILDDCRTEGLTPPKTHWARRIETAPFYAYPVRPGITFTYLGTRVNRQARMIMTDGRPSANMLAAGEIMAGNVLGQGYAAGIGMTIGSVFGRIAGMEAARHASN
jgi:tricarballylate dehydrogenase